MYLQKKMRVCIRTGLVSVRQVLLVGWNLSLELNMHPNVARGRDPVP